MTDTNQKPPLVAGTVEDPNGASVAQAAVKLIPQPTGTALKTVTDDAGHFVFTGVAPGEYILRVKVPGFKKPKLRLTVGPSPTPAQRVGLRVATVTEEITLRHYGVVWEKQLTRSGLPENDAGWMWLRSQGVKSVVTFLSKNDVDYNKFGFEHVLRFPISHNPPTDSPSDQQAEEFLRFIQDPDNAPVHMHCTAGTSRTGMMAALAQFSIDGWPMEKALEEARRYRHGKDLPQRRVAWLYNWASRHKPASYRLNR